MRSQNSRTRWNAPPGGAVEDTPGLGEAPLMGIIGRRADYKTFRLLLQNGGLPGPLRLVLALVQILSRERAAKLHFAETEAVAQTVGGLGESCELFAAFRLQQIELVVAVREAAKSSQDSPRPPTVCATASVSAKCNLAARSRRGSEQ